MKSLNAQVSYSILKPIEQVYHAIVDKEQISNYFTTRSDSDLIEGKVVNWEWDDFGAKFQSEVLKIKAPHMISFRWSATGQKTTVEIALQSKGKNQTQISITDGPFDHSEEGIQKALQQTIGWTDFICSLKAYLYTGINLRNGQFEKK